MICPPAKQENVGFNLAPEPFRNDECHSKQAVAVGLTQVGWSVAENLLTPASERFWGVLWTNGSAALVLDN